MRAWKYLFTYIVPFSVFISLYYQGYWSYFAVIVVFGIFPTMELFMSASTENLTKVEEEVAKADRTYDLILYSLVPIQYGLLLYFLISITKSEPAVFETIGMVLSFGISCGVLGINAAHELGHRSTNYEQTMSKLLLLTSMYMHFFIEHNRGHHKNVSTDEDPASSKYGETLYAFFLRTIKGSWLSAWKLEKERLKKTQKGFWSIHNEMLRFQIIQIVFLIAIYSVFGLQSSLLFLMAAIVGFLLLETVNYIEHYGLRRKKTGERYERVLPVHSWNSNHPIGRLVLLELSRHSDHHFIANRKYQLLRHFDESPQMPTGYPGMMLLSFFPPLWFRVMHKRIETYKATQEGVHLA
jgi:alkane 1-monooxygenase